MNLKVSQLSEVKLNEKAVTMRYIDSEFCDYSDDNKDMFENIYYDADDRNYMNNSTDSEDLNFHQNLVW